MGTRACFASLFCFISACAALASPTPPPGAKPYSVDFSRLTVAKTWEESKATFEERRQAVLWSVALGPLPEKFTGGEFPDAVLARLELGYDVAAANEAVLRPSTKIYGHCGTDAAPLGKLCQRVGDYDFALKVWVAILYRFWDQPALLWPETRAKILHELSPEKGNVVHNYRFFCGIPVHETENHILMTEGSKYLTNQLLARERHEHGLKPRWIYENNRNGMTKWMLKHLQQFLLQDFEEYNSRPYQPYALMAIQNLYEFAEDARVRTMARNVLDYLSAKFALSSAGMRRLPPFRRNEEYWGNWSLYQHDGESIRMLGLTGNAAFLAGYAKPLTWDFGVSIAMPALLGSYRLPELVGDWLFQPEHAAGFERFSFDALELYARRPEYLVSAGGIYTKIQKWIPFKMPNDGFTNPTTLIPAAGTESDAHNLIRIEGHTDFMKRINTCVVPDFACGVNPVVPATLPAGCVVRDADPHWTFVNFTGPSCPLDYGFYAAVFSQPCDTKACRKGGSTFGFFEAAPASALPFDEFMTRVLVYNRATRFSAKGLSRYITSAGHDIQFKMMPGDSRVWPIVAYDGRKAERRTSKWPFIQGEHLRADRRGHVVLENQALGAKLTLDVSDPLNPRRTEM